MFAHRRIGWSWRGRYRIIMLRLIWLACAWDDTSDIFGYLRVTRHRLRNWQLQRVHALKNENCHADANFVVIVGNVDCDKSRFSVRYGMICSHGQSVRNGIIYKPENASYIFVFHCILSAMFSVCDILYLQQYNYIIFASFAFRIQISFALAVLFVHEDDKNRKWNVINECHWYWLRKQITEHLRQIWLRIVVNDTDWLRWKWRYFD